LLIGDTEDVEIVYSEIPGAKDASAVIGPGFFTVPCAAVPTVGLVFQDTLINIPPDVFNFGQIEEGSQDCVGGLMGDDIGKSHVVLFLHLLTTNCQGCGSSEIYF
jgi:hypothetical protein